MKYKIFIYSNIFFVATKIGPITCNTYMQTFFSNLENRYFQVWVSHAFQNLILWLQSCICQRGIFILQKQKEATPVRIWYIKWINDDICWALGIEIGYNYPPMRWRIMVVQKLRAVFPQILSFLIDFFKVDLYSPVVFFDRFFLWKKFLARNIEENNELQLDFFARSTWFFSSFIHTTVNLFASETRRRLPRH